MHSINPYLRAFFKSTLLSQCNPVNNHILLVPTTECLLTGRDRESNSAYVDIVSSEDFLASHVLRISNTQAPGEGNVRDSRGKAKQFNTINGRTVVVKESFVYSNKGESEWTSSVARLTFDQDFEISTKPSFSATSSSIPIPSRAANGSYITFQDLLSDPTNL